MCMKTLRQVRTVSPFILMSPLRQQKAVFQAPPSPLGTLLRINLTVLLDSCLHGSHCRFLRRCRANCLRQEKCFLDSHQSRSPKTQPSYQPLGKSALQPVFSWLPFFYLRHHHTGLCTNQIIRLREQEIANSGHKCKSFVLSIEIDLTKQIPYKYRGGCFYFTASGHRNSILQILQRIIGNSANIVDNYWRLIMVQVLPQIFVLG